MQRASVSSVVADSPLPFQSRRSACRRSPKTPDNTPAGESMGEAIKKITAKPGIGYIGYPIRQSPIASHRILQPKATGSAVPSVRAFAFNRLGFTWPNPKADEGIGPYRFV